MGEGTMCAFMVPSYPLKSGGHTDRESRSLKSRLISISLETRPIAMYRDMEGNLGQAIEVERLQLRRLRYTCTTNWKGWSV